VSVAATPCVASAIARRALPNGLRVVVRENPAAAVVAMTLCVGVGAGHETAATNGVTALLGRALLKGTRTRSAAELARAAEDAGGGLEAATDQEYSEVRACGLGRSWRDLLGLLHEVATWPSLAPGEVEREREALAAQVRGLEDQPFAVASRVLARALYGSHPYAFPTTGELDTVSRLTPDALARHHAAFYTPERMVLAVSYPAAIEAVTAEDLLRAAERHLGEPAVVIVGPE